MTMLKREGYNISVNLLISLKVTLFLITRKVYEVKQKFLILVTHVGPLRPPI